MAVPPSREECGMQIMRAVPSNGHFVIILRITKILSLAFCLSEVALEGGLLTISQRAALSGQKKDLCEGK